MSRNKPRRLRRVWRARLRRVDDAFEVETERGCWERLTDKAGEVLEDRRDEERRLFANVGDRLVVVTDDAIAVLEVLDVLSSDWREAWMCSVLAGELGNDNIAHVMRGPRSRS